MTPAEVAARLEVGRHVVYALAHRHELPTVRVGRLLRVPRAAVEDFLARGGSLSRRAS